MTNSRTATIDRNFFNESSFLDFLYVDAIALLGCYSLGCSLNSYLEMLALCLKSSLIDQLLTGLKTPMNVVT